MAKKQLVRPKLGKKATDTIGIKADKMVAAARELRRAEQAKIDEAEHAPVPRKAATLAKRRMHDAARILESLHHVTRAILVSDPSENDAIHVAYIGEQLSKLANHRIDQALAAIGEEWFMYSGAWVGDSIGVSLDEKVGAAD